MFGREALAELQQQKKALVLESELNRLKLRAELRTLLSRPAWLGRTSRLTNFVSVGPMLAFLAPIAGFLLFRGFRRSDSWLNRLASLAKWLGPVYALWKRFSAKPVEPATSDPVI